MDTTKKTPSCGSLEEPCSAYCPASSAPVAEGLELSQQLATTLCLKPHKFYCTTARRSCWSTWRSSIPGWHRPLQSSQQRGQNVLIYINVALLAFFSSNLSSGWIELYSNVCPWYRCYTHTHLNNVTVRKAIWTIFWKENKNVIFNA